MEIALHLENDHESASIATSDLNESSSDDDDSETTCDEHEHGHEHESTKPNMKPLTGYNYNLPTIDIDCLEQRHLKFIMMGTDQDPNKTTFDFWKQVPIHKIFLLNNVMDDNLHNHAYRLPLPGDVISLLIFNEESNKLYDSGYTTITAYDIKLGYVKLIDFLFTAFD